jgi:hypothetical protein
VVGPMEGRDSDIGHATSRFCAYCAPKGVSTQEPSSANVAVT